MKQYLVCGSCGSRVSGLLAQQVKAAIMDTPSEEMLVGVGEYYVSEEGDYYISVSDKGYVVYHDDDNRMIGCCGPSVDGLPNLVCEECKMEVGREVTDCCTAHWVVLYKDAVHIKVDESGVMEGIAGLGDQRRELEMLVRYGQEAEVWKLLKK